MASKYKAVRTEVDGITFASKKEARRYGELKLLERAGHVRNIVVQPRFDLYAHDLTVEAKLRRIRAAVDGRHDPVKPVKVATYVADFQYEQRALSASENERWQKVIEDVKGVRTAVYQLKRKMFEAQYGLPILET